MQSVLGGGGSTVLAPKQNSLQMNQPPQLLSPCAWTVHPLEGGLACLPWLWKGGVLGAVPPPDHGAWWAGQVVGSAIYGLRLLLMEQKRLAK